jgi:hypothetical protein
MYPWFYLRLSRLTDKVTETGYGLLMTVFQDVMACNLVVEYQHHGETWRLRLQGNYPEVGGSRPL